ncbi:MAG: AraC family transcriptional regulator [Amaricoccus sp.]
MQEPIVPPPSESFVWRCDDYPLPWTVWNSHPECEIHLIRNASGTSYVGDHIGPFGAGDLYVVGRDLPHHWVTPLPAGGSIERRDVVIQFDQDRLLEAGRILPELGRVARLVERAQRGLSFHGSTRREAGALAEAVGEAKGLDRLARLFQLLQLLGDSSEYRVLSSAGFTPTVNEQANRALRDVLQHIATHMSEEIRVADVAELAGMSESSFSRFFRRVTGNTFTRHVGEMRTGKACELLARTDRAITEICHEVGYCNISNFNRAFRDLRGMTPSQYRQLSRS